jgi:hypothetical protein
VRHRPNPCPVRLDSIGPRRINWIGLKPQCNSDRLKYLPNGRLESLLLRPVPA